MKSNFDRFPVVKVEPDSSSCWVGWKAISDKINEEVSSGKASKVIVVVDCYQGVYHHELVSSLKDEITHHHFFDARESFLSQSEIDKMVEPFVTDDPVFGYMTNLKLEDFFDRAKLKMVRDQIEKIPEGIVIVYGPGATLLAASRDILIYADIARWEIQQRMRRNEISNLGVHNRELKFALQYKRGFFVDWRVLDRHKVSLMHQWDFLLDTNQKDHPKLATGASILKGLKIASQKPFRVVPFFDPGPWGGQWMKEVCDLDRSVQNYAWCFDCVPEENSLFLGFGDQYLEIPSIDLVFDQPENLLGSKVYERFGAEFPIRFDFLDTMDGGNLSLQVHPTTKYIRENFGMQYTQDESYYMLDAKENAHVYLGLNQQTDPEEMITALKDAQNGGDPFDAEKYVTKWDVKKHDHVLIPAGTVHCSGKDSMVLEISATPYIFTFKLWDWGRMGLDGKPRPINIEHGKNVIQWNRTQDWTKENILHLVEKVDEGNGWVEERTGLHESQFIETRRHWFTKKVTHNTLGGVNVLNLIEGREAIVESPDDSFEPFIVHYAETFIVPAAVGEFTIKPHGEAMGTKCGTIKAFVRV